MIDERAVSRLATVLTGARGDHSALARQHSIRVAPLLSEREREALVHSAVSQVTGMGPLQRHLDDPDVTEVMVVDGRHVWVECNGSLVNAGNIEPDDLSLCLERIARTASRRLDLLSPILDCVLADGSRVCAVIPPVAVTGPSLSIRKFARRILPLAGFGSPRAVGLVEELVHARCNVVVSGATSSGKTSLISAVSHRFGGAERIVCIEDTSELRFAHPHVVRLQARAANTEGNGEITVQQLVRTSMRMRPDRLVVGEVRGAEVVDMLIALSSGHTGCWSTIHSTGATDTIDRIRALIIRDAPQWTPSIIDQTIGAAINAVIHMERTPQRQRRITSIVRLAHTPDGIETESVYERGTS